jgi:hypothetical protein
MYNDKGSKVITIAHMKNLYERYRWLQLHEEPVSLTWLLFLYSGITKVRLMCTHTSGDKGSGYH